MTPPLVIAPAVGVPFTQDFNPFDPHSTASEMGIRSLVYEPLYEIDALTPSLSGMHPWLATGYTFDNGGTELRLTIRGGVRLSDNTDFGPADVAATYRAIRDDPAADYSHVPAQSADPTISGSTVTLWFSTPQYTSIDAILGDTYMVPASLISTLGSDLATGTVSDPVGTGPFVLDAVSSQTLRFGRNPHYWGGPPPEPAVDVAWEATADALSEAAEVGTVDWSGTAPSIVWSGPDLNPDTSHVWFASGTTVTLEFNLAPGNGGATGIDDPAVRQAVSLGIDRTVLSSIGESGLEAAATSAGGLTPGQQAVYPNPAYTNDLPADSAATSSTAPRGWTGPTVQSVLEADGWTPPAAWGTFREATCDGTVVGNCWSRDGEIIRFSIWDPEPVSDIWADASEISWQLQGEGMDVTAQSSSDDASTGVAHWQEGLEAGDFQTALDAGAGGSIPFVQLDNWLDYSDDCASSGGAVSCPSGDYGRFQSAAAETALEEYKVADPSTAAGQVTIADATYTLEGIMADEVPDAPLVYGADFNTYSTAHYTGWPSLTDPYMDPSPADPELPYILMHLHAVP